MSFNIFSVTMDTSYSTTTRKQLKPSKYDDTIGNNVSLLKIFQIAKSIFANSKF